MVLRLQYLREKHRNLQLDVEVIASQELYALASTFFQSTLYFLDVSEMVMFTRGRDCQSNNSRSSSTSDCTTVFVDDYRYERNLVTTNTADWYGVTTALRGAAQLYVWTRVLLLMHALFIAQPSQYGVRARVWSAVLTAVRIPFQVVVYGSVIPTTLYVIAYLMDCNFIETKLDALWTTARGDYNDFDKLAFFRVCTMQMRNVWLMALLSKIWVAVQTRRSRWRPHMGVNGVRGMAISVTSFLSVFGPYRSVWFRNTSSLVVLPLDQLVSGRAVAITNEPSQLTARAIVPIGTSLVMTLFTMAVLLVVEVLIIVAGWALRHTYRHEILFGLSTLVPHSAGKLWSTTALSIRFHVGNVKFGVESQRSMKNLFSSSRVLPESATWCDAYYTLRLLQPNKDNFHLSEQQQSDDSIDRADATGAVIELMNMTMMSDPWTMFELRAVGITLFEYRVCPLHSRMSARSPTVILPYFPSEVQEWTGLEPHQFQVVHEYDSRDMPLQLLYQCS